ncbi:redoxin domain-containing protein [Flavobacterium sp. TAB 87]|uniref:redoxin domain-containing protein n=1 Tax=Flavobacterium sp. TAB 87 TaxID=1729581 RepID=UPI00076DDAA2|nr:redoxin domain-containing protein [Flavobacterium sp. TAB 87]KVV16359.1 thiol-disulfide oxidoreductase [Flavobacterium sp. TAB 87]
MKLTTKFTLFLIIIFLFKYSSGNGQVLQITGKVIGTDPKSIMLIKPTQDDRFDSIIEIPVIDGKFYYEEKLQNTEAVSLAFTQSVKDGGYRPMPLFLENEKINLTIYPELEFDKNIIEGGKLNAEYKKFKQSFDEKFNAKMQPLQDSINALYLSDEFLSKKAKKLYIELQEAKNQDEKLVIYNKLDELKKSNQSLSPKANELEDKIKPIYEKQKVFQREYIENNPTIVSYSFLLNSLIYNKETIDINSVKKSFQILSAANPDHPYNKLAYNLISAIENVKIDKKYTDFSAPDLKGVDIKISDRINGKIALIDLWATWCGSCIAKSRTMVPLYNEYKDKGFTIIGVAGEFKNTDRLVKFLDKEKWPWLILVELDRQNSIWQKYGVDGGGGGMFLIDAEGIILAKNPTVEEIRKELDKKLCR